MVRRIVLHEHADFIPDTAIWPGSVLSQKRGPSGHIAGDDLPITSAIYRIADRGGWHVDRISGNCVEIRRVNDAEMVKRHSTSIQLSN